jgi:hypothetical protein
MAKNTECWNPRLAWMLWKHGFRWSPLFDWVKNSKYESNLFEGYELGLLALPWETPAAVICVPRTSVV